MHGPINSPHPFIHPPDATLRTWCGPAHGEEGRTAPDVHQLSTTLPTSAAALTAPHVHTLS
eukprot:355228-Chlamydomonas_euryale.AAC.2